MYSILSTLLLSITLYYVSCTANNTALTFGFTFTGPWLWLDIERQLTTTALNDKIFQISVSRKS